MMALQPINFSKYKFSPVRCIQANGDCVQVSESMINVTEKSQQHEGRINTQMNAKRRTQCETRAWNTVPKIDTKERELEQSNEWEKWNKNPDGLSLHTDTQT